MIVKLNGIRQLCSDGHSCLFVRKLTKANAGVHKYLSASNHRQYIGVYFLVYLILYQFWKEQKNRIDNQVLRSAYDATCRKRETMFQKDDTLLILRRIEEDFEMQNR